jgi:outer membrane protein OmpA-like peptidoglycan-associated protein
VAVIYLKKLTLPFYFIKVLKMRKFLLVSLILGINALFSQEESPSAQSTISYPIFFEYKVGTMDSMEERRLPILLRNFDSFKIEKIEILAYCDERGTTKANDILSKKRAKSIYNNLYPLLHKLDTSDLIFITAEGRGMLPLIDQENIEDQRSKNRRGDVTFYYAKKVAPTAKPKKPAPKPPVVKLESFFASAKSGDKLELKIFFEGGRSSLLPESYEELDSLASILKTNDTMRINILGHIYANGYAQDIDGYDDATGTNTLSENRARVVYVYLNRKGINKKRLNYKGLGGKYPTGISAERDRRVEIEIAGKEATQDSAISQ